MTDFNSLGLAEPLLRSLVREGYTAPTPIQQRTIPPMLEGRDILGIAQTGTGKTAAFALPILQLLAAAGGRAAPKTCRALIMAPTRELAAQIAESFRTYGRNYNLTTAVIVGGVSYGPQIQNLSRGVDVLVCTPGRPLDHMANHAMRLVATSIVVLDEADHMLDLGFLVPIRRIVGKLPARRQTAFFSATMPREIGVLANDMLRDPVRVEVTPQATTVDKISQQVFLVEADRKRGLLVDLLKDASLARTLVFTRTKRGADKVASHLDAAGINAAAIHGNKSQAQRERALGSFKSGRTRVLVATDIAARGIDVDGITHVVNFELPHVPESYVHRIGRTARAGADGIAFSFCAGDERNLLRDIERTTRQQIPVTDRRGGLDSRGDWSPIAANRDEPREQDGRREHAHGKKPGGRPGHRHGAPAAKRDGASVASQPGPSRAHGDGVDREVRSGHPHGSHGANEGNRGGQGRNRSRNRNRQRGRAAA